MSTNGTKSGAPAVNGAAYPITDGWYDIVRADLASMAVARYSFDSPDEVGNLEDGVYMLSNLAALLVGWVIGWIVGGRLVSRPAPPA